MEIPNGRNGLTTDNPGYPIYRFYDTTLVWALPLPVIAAECLALFSFLECREWPLEVCLKRCKGKGGDSIFRMWPKTLKLASAPATLLVGAFAYGTWSGRLSPRSKRTGQVVQWTTADTSNQKRITILSQMLGMEVGGSYPICPPFKLLCEAPDFFL